MKRPEKQTYIDREIERVTLAMQDKEVDSKEYKELLDRLGDMQRIRQEERPDRLSSDTILIAATNILGIVLIISYEHSNVLTSRAIGMIRSPK